MEKDKKRKSPKKAHSKPIAKKSVASELKKEKQNEEIATKVDNAKTLQLLLLLILAIVLLVFLANKTFFRSYYSNKINDREVRIEIPRFTYLYSEKDGLLTFKTLRKSQNTIKYYDDYLNSDKFEIYKCANRKEPVYYNKLYNYFLYDVTVKKNFAMKTVTMKYVIHDQNLICDLFN